MDIGRINETIHKNEPLFRSVIRSAIEKTPLLAYQIKEEAPLEGLLNYVGNAQLHKQGFYIFTFGVGPTEPWAHNIRENQAVFGYKLIEPSFEITDISLYDIIGASEVKHYMNLLRV